ncbi:hypothetical protein PN36_07655 [Candidatus Thiomargarita nelsonii]|uniref:UbiA prenyltransferase n=1 Tax=Candidatus Thiomargarita nelsonii TaxID=1003181 RepID=A0A0A6P8F1_9GAMM|nr:hypothetical protein PN36_07655 [Candidatus Thiomargarita nelsonii]
MNDKTLFLSALRPFSLVVAVATCGLGVSLALIDQASDASLAWLVLIAGVLLQIAVNLINDSGENLAITASQRWRIKRNALVGWITMLIAVLLGLYMVSIRGWPLFVLGVVGVLGAWGYTGGRVNYKQRGLGILLVFLLMGVMLIGGSYYTLTGEYQWKVFCLSLPFSLLSSLLLLSNELRDYEEDLAAGIRTLSVRLGYQVGVKLYYLLVALLYFISALLFWANMLPSLLLLMMTALALWTPLKLLNAAQRQRRILTPLTGRFYFIFSIAYFVTIWMDLP